MLEPFAEGLTPPQNKTRYLAIGPDQRQAVIFTAGDDETYSKAGWAVFPLDQVLLINDIVTRDEFSLLRDLAKGTKP